MKGLIFLIGILGPSLTASAPYVWPTKDWSTSTLESLQIDKQSFERFLGYTFPESLDRDSRSGIRTNALVVVREGMLVYERYSNGTSFQRPHRAWSVSKLLLNALTGIAVDKKIIRLDDSVSQCGVPDRDRDWKDLKIRDLLAWSSGLKWNEGYEYNPVASDVIAMLYGRGATDIARYVMDRRFAHPPGTRFRYSSGDSNLLMHCLRRSMKPADYEDFPWTQVFEPLGISSASFETDAAGLYVASSYWHVSARDLAKLGLLYLNDGLWDKIRILPQGWVYQSSQIVPAYTQTERDVFEHNLSPGYHVWVNRSDVERGIVSPLNDAPDDLMAGLGHWGQSIYMIPSERLVVVRFADDRDQSFDANKFLRLLLESLPSTPLPRKGSP